MVYEPGNVKPTPIGIEHNLPALRSARGAPGASASRPRERRVRLSSVSANLLRTSTAEGDSEREENGRRNHDHCLRRRVKMQARRAWSVGEGSQ